MVKNQKQLERLLKLKSDSELAIFDHINELEEKVEDYKKLIPKLEDVLKAVKGQQGEAGTDGRDGQDGRDGTDGADGERGTDGVNGVNGKDGKNGRDGRDGRDGTDGVNGNDGVDGSVDTAQELAGKLNTLHEAIDGDVIKGWKDLKHNVTESLLHLPRGGDIRLGVSMTDLVALQRRVTTLEAGGGGGHTIQDEGTPLTARTNLNFKGAGVNATDDAANNATIVTISTSAGAGYQQSLSGVVDGSNKTYVWATAPNSLVVDGQMLQKTSTNGVVNWTGTTTTILTVEPTFDIFGVA